MKWLGRSVRKFTAAESFRLFIEGLRSLQAYDKQGESESPDGYTLNKLLERSERYFKTCIDNYEDDILPRYYFGIVLSIKGQLEQARSLRSQISTGAVTEVTSDLADAMFRQAAREFARVANQVNRRRGGRDVLVYALYNQAQALAKMGPQKKLVPQSPPEPDNHRPWDRALLILQKIYPQLVLANLVGWSRVSGRLHFVLGTLGFEKTLNSWLLKEKPKDLKQIAEGISAPLKAKQGEGRAFEIQVRVLEYAIQLRKSIYSNERVVILTDLPHSEERTESILVGDKISNVADERSQDGFETIRRYIAWIEMDPIPGSAMKDIVADYWNKLASIAWERAVLLGEASNGQWITKASRYISTALEGRRNWTPGQLTLARIQALQGNRDGALRTLELVQGRPRTSVPEVTVGGAANTQTT